MTHKLNDIVIFCTDPQTRNYYITDSIAHAFRNLLAADARVRVLNYAGLGEIGDTVDLFLAIGGSGAITEPLKRATRKAAISALWTTEDPYELKGNVKIAHLFDIVFTNDLSARQHYQGRVFHLPFAGSTKYHLNDVKLEKDEQLFDLFFVGTAWPERVKQIEQLLSLLKPSYRMKIGLSGNPHLPYHQISDLNMLTDFRLSPREFARMANRSAVALTLDRTFSGDSSNIEKGQTPPPRLFELALAGTAQVYVSERSTVGDYFRANEEVTLVNTIEAAAQEIERLVEDPERRNAMAIAAHRRACTEHLYENRVRQLIEAVKSIPLSALRSNVPAVAKTADRPAQPRVLFVSHNISGRQPFGGVELYQDSLVAELPECVFFVLYIDNSTLKVTLRNLTTGDVREFDAGPIPETVVSDVLREKILGDIISEYQFDLIHYHHLIGHPLSLPLISNAFGVPSVFQVHDYYSICQSFNLLSWENRFCGVRDHHTEVCDECLLRARGYEPGSQARRRAVMGRVLSSIDAFLHNSDTTLDMVQRIYPSLDYSRHHIVGNTARLETIKALQAVANERRAGMQSTERLQVAIVGNFSTEKGANWLVKVFDQLAHDNIDFRIIGRVDASATEALADKPRKTVEVIGAFDQVSLPGYLRGAEVSIHFSIWPETYCISLDETRAAGLVPIVLGYGALRERVRDGVDGYVINSDHPMDLVRLLRVLSVSREKLGALQANAPDTQQVYQQHFDGVKSVYNKLLSRRHALQPTIYRAERPLILGDLAIRFSSTNWNDSQVSFDDIEKSAAFGSSRGKTVKPEMITSKPAFEAHMLPGDDRLSVLVEGIECSIAERRTIKLPPFKTTLRFGVAVPKPLDRIPLDIALVGEKVFRGTQGARRYARELSDVTEWEWSIEALPVGSYVIYITFGKGDSLYRYRTAVSLNVGTESEAGQDVVSKTHSLPWKLPDLQSSTTFRQNGARSRNSVVDVIKRALPGLMQNKATVVLDQICGIVNPPEDVTLKRSENASIRLSGWTVDRQSKTPLESVYIRFALSDKSHLTMARVVMRPDVAAALGSNMAVASGFEAEIPLAEFTVGTGYLDILAATSSAEIFVIKRITVLMRD